MRIVKVDMDGVLVDPHQKILDRVNEEFGTDYSTDEWTVWDTDWMEEPEHGELVMETFRDRHLYRGLDPLPGALEGVKVIKEFANVVIVSSPMIGHADSKLGWLEQHGFGSDERVLVSDKSLVNGDVLIDDALHNVEDSPHPAVLMDRPWNRNGRYDPRAKNWREAVRYTARCLL